MCTPRKPKSAFASRPFVHDFVRDQVRVGTDEGPPRSQLFLRPPRRTHRQRVPDD